MNKKRIGTTYANCAMEAGKNTIVAHDTSVSKKKAPTSHRSMVPPGRWTVSPVTFDQISGPRQANHRPSPLHRSGHASLTPRWHRARIDRAAARTPKGLGEAGERVGRHVGGPGRSHLHAGSRPG